MTRFNTKTLTLLSALALSAGFTHAVNADQQNNSNLRISTTSTNNGKVSNGGQWQTLSNGCSYSRAQAPGYAPTWHLIVNPQTVGLPKAPRKCKPMLQG